MRFTLYITLLLSSFSAFAQEGKKVQFVGGARSLLSHSDFTSKTDAEDTVTARKMTGGYALLDLGFKINPNATTEILGMIRIKNDFGGFWGSGVNFDVRQLYVKGVAANVLRYQIGNIDYKLSPYTFYNHNADMLVQSTASLKIKEDIVNYESFYKNNTWRQQGAAADFALKFPKVIQEMKFNGFITRMNPTNMTNILERFYGGGNITIVQSKYFTIGGNHVSVFDLKQTAASNDAYRNSVSTGTFASGMEFDKIKFGIDGETGFSNSFSSQDNEGKLSDYFVNAKLNVEAKKLGIKFNLGYMDNGADFRSAGAQSKRVDYNQVNNYYDRYTNAQIVRPLSMYDLYNDPTLYTSSINTGIMAYNPSINNALPYGTATFNRKGIYSTLSYEDKKKIVAVSATYYKLSEIRGQGTLNLKSFDYLKGNLVFDVSNLLKWKLKQIINVGVAYQNTQRKSDLSFEKISLKSTTMNVGVELEIVKDLSILGNAFMFSSVGNELLPVRNDKGEIINFNPYIVDGQELNISAGLKFNFSKDVYLACLYEQNKNNFNTLNPYNIKQLMLFYVMKF
jgi:hypothetical protein